MGWSTLYGAIAGPGSIAREDFLANMRDILGPSFRAPQDMAIYAQSASAVITPIPGMEEEEDPNARYEFSIGNGIWQGAILPSNAEAASAITAITAVVWNLEQRQAMSRSDYSALQSALNARFAQFEDIGYLVLTPGFVIRNYGETISSYRGVPPIPGLPASGSTGGSTPERTPPNEPSGINPWLVGGGVALALLALSQIAK